MSEVAKLRILMFIGLAVLIGCSPIPHLCAWLATLVIGAHNEIYSQSGSILSAGLFGVWVVPSDPDRLK